MRRDAGKLFGRLLGNNCRRFFEQVSRSFVHRGRHFRQQVSRAVNLAQALVGVRLDRNCFRRSRFLGDCFVFSCFFFDRIQFGRRDVSNHIRFIGRDGRRFRHFSGRFVQQVGRGGFGGLEQLGLSCDQVGFSYVECGDLDCFGSLGERSGRLFSNRGGLVADQICWSFQLGQGIDGLFFQLSCRQGFGCAGQLVVDRAEVVFQITRSDGVRQLVFVRGGFCQRRGDGLGLLFSDCRRWRRGFLDGELHLLGGGGGEQIVHPNFVKAHRKGAFHGLGRRLIRLAYQFFRGGKLGHGCRFFKQFFRVAQRDRLQVFKHLVGGLGVRPFRDDFNRQRLGRDIVGHPFGFVAIVADRLLGHHVGRGIGFHQIGEIFKRKLGHDVCRRIDSGFRRFDVDFRQVEVVFTQFQIAQVEIVQVGQI